MEICEWKYKLKYVDGEKERDTPYNYMKDGGLAFHADVASFFDNKPLTGGYGQEHWDNFLKFNQQVLQDQKPVMFETKIYDEQLDFTGIVDAVFINPADGEYVIIDWKTGKMKDHDEIREEMACYKLIIDRSKLLPKPVKYWAMFFSKGEPLFFEECKNEFVDVMLDKIQLVRSQISQLKFSKNPRYCFMCGYHERFGGVCEGK